jgi:integrase
MSKKHQRTTTFPVEWNQITKLESVLLHEFIDNPTKRNGINLLMITLGSRFGLRVSDLLSIRWNHIMGIEPDQTFTLIEKKTKKIRQIKMTKKVKTILNQVSPTCYMNPDDHIFSSQKSGNKPMTIQNFNIRLKKLFNDHRIKTKNNISSHLLRKSFVVQSIKSGLERGDHLSLIKVSHLINHSSVNQTIKYCNYESETLNTLYDLD